MVVAAEEPPAHVNCLVAVSYVAIGARGAFWVPRGSLLVIGSVHRALVFMILVVPSDGERCTVLSYPWLQTGLFCRARPKFAR